MKENKAVLLLGSNMGDRKWYLQQTLLHLVEEVGVQVQLSSIYETQAWGNESQSDFYNQVVVFQTIHSPEKLLKIVLNIELKLDRKRVEKWGSRTIDIDILFYNNEIITQEYLEIPHPFLHLRKFTVIPLVEIMPNYVHPKLNLTMHELFHRIKSEDLLIVKNISHE